MPEFLGSQRTKQLQFMMGKHNRKYPQNYRIITIVSSLLLLLGSCAMKRIPEGSYLLTSNKFNYQDKKLFTDQIPDYVIQKPNKKAFFLAPVGLWLYSGINPKLDPMLESYATFPNELRNQHLRDSLVTAFGHPEFKGKSLLWNRFFHTVGQDPVIFSRNSADESTTRIRQFYVFKGYWRAKTSDSISLNDKTKKATVTYNIKHNDPTFIQSYTYKIAEDPIRNLYVKNLAQSPIKAGQVLDQSVLEQEADRFTKLMRDNGYYNFNSAGDEIFFTADTLKGTKDVPLTFEFKRDSAQAPYVVNKFKDVNVFVTHQTLTQALADSIANSGSMDSLRGIKFYNPDKKYKNNALWSAIIIKPGDIYNQSEIDLTRRNLVTMNNFTARVDVNKPVQDSMLHTNIYLTPLPKYEIKLATDVHYSEILNFGLSPSLELTTRNIFHGAQNLTTSFSGIVGTTNNAKNPNKFFNAYELSLQLALNVPRLLVPFKYWKLIPKRFSPKSSILLGGTMQNNIGLGRISVNSGLQYSANVRDIISHQLTLFNTQFNFTRNKGKYYDLFQGDRALRDLMFNDYFQSFPLIGQQYNSGALTGDEVSNLIMGDKAYQNAIGAPTNPTFVNFQQTLLNKDRLTQDVIINSFTYNFIYNEIGRKEFLNPFYLSFKVESAGNVLSLFNGLFQSKQTGIANQKTNKTIFGIPYSQFVKFDLDVRKYLTLFNNPKQKLVFRQFIGIGIPYGNSSVMPYMRSYFNGGSSDIRAWLAFGGLGPSDIQIDKAVRAYMMDNMKLTTNIEYRFPVSKIVDGALFTDAGNIWSLKNTGLNDEFRFSQFYKQLGVGSGFGLRFNIAYITLRLDLAYKMYDPNQPVGQRWQFRHFNIFKPTLNFAFGYPF